MRKVGEVMEEIEKMENHHRIISDIANKMLDDESIRKYMMNNFHVDAETMSSIARNISIRASRLKDSLKECEVDI